MSDLAVVVSHLEKVYPSRGQAVIRALDDVSFSVERGRIFGLLGPNGAGKTTTLKILTTLLAPTAGRAEVLGFDAVHQPLEVRRRISLVIQETAVELFLSVRDNLLTFARFHGLRGTEAHRRAGRVMEMFRLSGDADRKIQDLSGGFRRRVQVAKIFMVETPVVFLDEFSTGMDPLLKRDVMGYIREASASGRTILLTTQILHEAEELCDDILILNQGRQLARGNLHSLKLLTENVYDVTLTFDRLPEGIEAELAKHKPIRLELVQNTIEVTLKGEEQNVLELVTGLAGRGRLLRMEVAGATLEDIFVELVRNSNGSPDPARKQELS